MENNRLGDILGGRNSAIGYGISVLVSLIAIVLGFAADLYWVRLAGFFLLTMTVARGGFRYMFHRLGYKFQKEASLSELPFYEKKAPELETNRYSGIFVGLLGNVGLLVALGVVLAAFEWRQYDKIEVAQEQSFDVQEEEVMEVPITEYTPPPPQPIQQPEIVEVEDDEEIEEEEEVELETEIEEEVTVDEQYDGPTMVGGTGDPDDFMDEEEEVDEVFLIAEEDAEFPGGFGAWMGYLKENIKYSNQARRMQIEGKVFVQFTIEKDGSVTGVHVVRGLGYGLDKEAIRVVQNSPKWQPAKQRGRPVRLKKTLPVVFKLR